MICPEEQYYKLLDVFGENVIASKTDLKGKITYVSDAFCEISGYTREELMGQSHNIVRHPDMPNSLFKELWDTINASKVFKAEIKNRKKDGGYYWVDVSISPMLDEFDNIVGYTAIRHDITTLKELESVNYEHKKLIDTFAKHVIASKTDLKGNITYVSDAFCKISGYTQKELLGKPHNIVRHPDMSKTVYKKLWDTIEKDKEFSGELKNKTKAGGSYWVNVNISPDYDQVGKKIGYIAIRTDISQQKELEEKNSALETMIKELKRSKK